MAIQALAPYYLSGRAEVRHVVDKALVTLSAIQNSDGGYQSQGVINCESTAQVIIALCSLGIDPHTDPRFIKNGQSLIEHMLKFKAPDGGFKHTLDGQANDKASEQALLALIAYVRMKDGKSPLYDYQGISLVSDRQDTKRSEAVGEVKQNAGTGGQEEGSPAESEGSAPAMSSEKMASSDSGGDPGQTVPETESVASSQKDNRKTTDSTIVSQAGTSQGDGETGIRGVENEGAIPNADLTGDQAEVAAMLEAAEQKTSDVGIEEGSMRRVQVIVGLILIAGAAVVLLTRLNRKIN